MGLTAERDDDAPDDERADDAPRPLPKGSANDAALVGRLRLGDEDAFREYFDRYAPLLREMARRYGVRDDTESLVTDVLDDVAERVRAHRVPKATALGPYLVSTLRNRATEERRAAMRHAALERDAADATGADGESVVRSLCSAYALRAVRAPDDEDVSTPDEHVSALHAFIGAQLDEEERRILGWVAERVPQREIAAWTGTTHGAARVRVHRLRARLLRAARAWLDALEPEARRAIARTHFREPVRGARATRPAPARQEEDA